MLLQGTRPRSASDTLMSRRNIPASPLLPSPPLRADGVVGAATRQGCEPRATRLGKSVRGEGEGNTRVGYRRQLAGKLGLAAGYGGGSVGTSGHFPEGSSRQGLL